MSASYVRLIVKMAGSLHCGMMPCTGTRVNIRHARSTINSLFALFCADIQIDDACACDPEATWTSAAQDTALLASHERASITHSDACARHCNQGSLSVIETARPTMRSSYSLTDGFHSPPRVVRVRFALPVGPGTSAIRGSADECGLALARPRANAQP